MLSGDKQYLVESRLLPIARKAGLGSLGALVGALRQNADDPLMTRVVEAMTTNETFFFRDKTPFENFRSTVLPSLFAARRITRSIRIWCAAASTGQEPYSLAMALKEMEGVAAAGWRFELIATDLSNEVLEKAREGHLQPVRGAARTADPATYQAFRPDRRDVADRPGNSRHGQVPAAQPSFRFLPARHFRCDLLP